MQQVAEEAGMSAGNLYRYFPSKEALVEGICMLDQRERGAAFHALAHSGDVLGTLETMLRDNLLNKPRHKALMFLEVAAEAGRNPRIAEMMRTNDAEVIAGLTHLIETAKANGEAVAALDASFAARLMFTYVGGLFRRRALDERFEVEAEAAMTMALLRALFAGAITPSNPTETV
jgi:AcrR family transcriptional regulator